MHALGVRVDVGGVEYRVGAGKSGEGGAQQACPVLPHKKHRTCMGVDATQDAEGGQPAAHSQVVFYFFNGGGLGIILDPSVLGRRGLAGFAKRERTGERGASSLICLCTLLRWPCAVSTAPRVPGTPSTAVRSAVRLH